MKQTLKRFLSIALACVMLFGMLPVSAFAEDTAPEEPPVVLTEPQETVVEETTVPVTTVPETTVPETTVPETTVPETTVPETTVPETTVPETTVPETTVPETTVPETTIPETTVSETTVPETTVPETTVPETTVPETTVPEETVPEETTEEVSVAEGYLQQINALKAQADALGGNGPECADIYNSLMKINDQVIADKESGVITDEEYNEIYNAIGSVMMVLFGYGYDPYAVATVADTPQMKYYNDTNKVAYDVAESDYRGYNDYTGKYVQSVTLGGKTVTQANSNESYTESSVDDRVGQALSVYYPNVDTGDAEAEATLAITPAPGYYVSKIVVACCDVNVAYKCGTWSAGKVFTKSFDVSTGGTLTTTLPTSAFGHGTSSNHYSTNGKAQYFILIRVAPVPEPLYVAYEYGSIGTVMGSDLASSPFANANKWVSASTANNYGTGGSNQTPYTQFKYAYAANSEVANWKHVTDTVTQEAKLAAAEKGYYFTGWKATYYSNCTSRYVFSNVYSEATGLIGENQDLRLVTHVKLVAQWAPVKLNVEKVVTGLPINQSYTINLLKNGAASETITFNGEGTKSYSPIAAGTYSVTEVGENQRVTIGDKEYDLTTTYSDPVALTAENIASGALREATLTVTNAYKEVEKTSVTVTKKWDDADNQDGIRPTSITVHLLADGKEVGSATLNAETGWAYTFNNLDKYDGNQEITYTVAEDKVDGYTASIVGHIITNIHTPETTKVEGSKTWDDANNQDGIRPDSITVNLLADGKVNGKSVTVTAEDGWAWEFTELPKYRDGGVEIVYSVSEVKVEGYTTTVSGMDITNTHTPETIDISGSKTWDDANNQDGKRPDSITINLLANGTQIDSKTVTAAAGWKWSFTDLDKYANGVEINYTIEEDDVAEYTSKVDGYNVTNTHVPEKISVSGSKNWDDANNQDGIRPESITVNLLADGETIDTVTVTAAAGWKWSFTDLDKYAGGKEILYTVTEEAVDGYDVTYVKDSYDITNTHTPEKIDLSVEKQWDDNNDQDGKRPESITVNLLANGKQVATAEIIPDADGNWTYTFAGFDKYVGGEEIIYTVEEAPVEGYTPEIDGMLITNKHTPEKIDISGTKTWDDNDDQDGKRPDSITINLLADGTEIKEVKVTEADGWKWSFTDLDKYAEGKEIIYTITEDAVTGYESKVDGYNITNTHKIETTKVEGVKTWDDANNQDNKRPASITINLYGDEELVESKTVTENDGWAWSFENLPVYKAGEVGQKVVYTITEDEVAGYTAAVNGFNVTNKHEIETTKVEGVKIWDDAGNQDNKRPASIIINLYGDEELVETKTVTENDGWAWSFENLPVYKAGEVGQKVVYTITEDEVAGYTATVNGFNVTNKHEIETTKVEGVKTWDDAGNQDGKRPASIIINLYGDEELVESKTVTEKDGWAWSFENLPVYKAGEVGQKIVYTITEDKVDGYTTTYDGYNVTNTHAIETTKVEGAKNWSDAGNQDNKRPDEITINLLADGVEIKEAKVTAADGWKWSFENLPVYKAGAVGKEIVYTITEDEVAGYESKVEGYNVTNTHKVDLTEVTVTKVWDDADNQDGIRPASVTVQLKADGEAFGDPVVLSSSNEWTHNFTDLEVNKKGQVGVAIDYTVEELNVPTDYTAEVTGTQADGYTITNSHEVYKTEVSVSKAWDDADDQDGLRPESVTVMLYADNNPASEPVVLSEDNGWTYTFKDLDEKVEGRVIGYTVEEMKVPTGYTVAVTGSHEDGYTITNTHTPATTAVEGKKIWEDDEDRDGLRPESITINLVADGEIIETVEVTEAEGWAWSFTDLSVYRDHGTEIVYEITEEAVDGYETVVDGFSVTNTHKIATTQVKGAKTWNDDNDRDGLRPESITISLLADGQVIDTVVVTEAEGWAWSFEELPVYRDQGIEIVYTVAEATVEGYEIVIEGFDITNTHEIATVSVEGAKTWDDADNQDGKRPESITINLVADGQIIETIAVTEAEGWAWSFTDLPKYKDQGVEIVYAITEEAVEGYSTTYDGYNVINSYTPEEISVTVTKAWADSNNAEGIRPGSVTIRLMANGVFTGLTLDLSAESKWVGSFTGLPKYFNGELVEYTVDEVAVKGYTTVIKGSMEEGFTVTNSHVYIPQTGDDRTPMMWISLMAVSAMMIALASIDSKKRRSATK